MEKLALLLLVIVIVMLFAACYYFEKTVAANPLDIDVNRSPDKKINDFLRAKNYQPIHPNLIWLLFIPACLFTLCLYGQPQTN
jgi:hypothetical protein